MKIVLASAKIIDGDIQSNINQMQKYMIQAHHHGADLVCFGEAFLQGFNALTWKYENDRTIAVVLDNVHIGAVSISLDDTKTEGEIGWIINKRYWNHGYAFEAASAVLSFSKHHLHLQKVIAQCDWRNDASARVMEKIGMHLIDDQGTRTYRKRNETARELTYMIDLTK